MKGKMNHFLGLFFVMNLFIIFSFTETQAQQGCSQNLEIARNLFNEGQYYEIGNTLNDNNCLASGFSRAEKIEALELLALTEMYLDHQESADSTYLALLRIDPEHTVDLAADPPDLVFLHKSFITKPLFSWTVEAGINQVYPRIIYQYSIFPEFIGADSVMSDIQNKTNFSIGAGLEFPVIVNLSIGVNAQFMYGGYDEKFNAKIHNSEGTNPIRFSWINIPVYVRYQFGKSRLKPYLTSGAVLNLLVSSDLEGPVRKDLILGDLNSENWNLNNLLTRLNYSGMVGGGLIFKTAGISSLAFDVSYRFGIKNYSNESKRFSIGGNQRAPITQNYVQDAVRIDHVQVSLKYLRPIYKPRKILPK